MKGIINLFQILQCSLWLISPHTHCLLSLLVHFMKQSQKPVLLYFHELRMTIMPASTSHALKRLLCLMCHCSILQTQQASFSGPLLLLNLRPSCDLLLLLN